ncbi:hypothetical protein BZA05DRAFT_403834 [Tricharina praecox]|uniref:uncharacterized protein n=1 Tax=Tricharina praecox TaxID=43433 RepID=UPI00221FF274|nr:uncharacterized protein BZA05DRAFT_403834 [Tricharina praecox]KAI5848356.1 hypothetical protein BZA05DRAFT_403834 [Tricharina praecox]
MGERESGEVRVYKERKARKRRRQSIGGGWAQRGDVGRTLQKLCFFVVVVVVMIVVVIVVVSQSLRFYLFIYLFIYLFTYYLFLAGGPWRRSGGLIVWPG